MDDKTTEAELTSEEVERRAGEIARRLMNTPPVKRSPNRDKKDGTKPSEER